MTGKEPDRRTVNTDDASSYHTVQGDDTGVLKKDVEPVQTSGSRFRESDSVMNSPTDGTATPTTNGRAQPKAVDHAYVQPALGSPGNDNDSDAAPGYTPHLHGSIGAGDPKRGSIDERRSLRSANGSGSQGGLPPTAVGAFAEGAATSGPRAAPDGDLAGRATIAEQVIGADITRKLTKREAKDAKRLSKVLKSEAKTEQQTLQNAIKELERLQKVQKQAAAAENAALAKFTKASRQENKLNQVYIAAKTKWEQASAYLKSSTDALEASREHARTATEMLREKTAEVDRLRAQKATDDRERQAKLAALSSPGR